MAVKGVWSRPEDQSHRTNTTSARGGARPSIKGRIWLAVNDEARQQSRPSRADLSVPEIIWIASRSIELRSGDLISTHHGAGWLSEVMTGNDLCDFIRLMVAPRANCLTACWLVGFPDDASSDGPQAVVLAAHPEIGGTPRHIFS